MEDGRSSTGKKKALRLRGSAFLATGCVAIALFASACGGDDSGKGVAGSKTGTNASATPAKKADPIEFSKCMREHGVTGFPDLDANGNSVGTPGPDAVDGKSPVFQAAEKACSALKPGQKSRPDMSKYRNDQIKYSKCMRDKGVSNFPDPNAKGDLELDPSKSGIDPKSEQFKTAEKACRPLLVVPPGAQVPQG
ncbi:hypothetical protein BTM25_36350 [Actinomadura rubteroloni]|uniref:Secreted protein n=1 Tax=Actinomadura rubteroloni TaxID=1926885 RepID=A0A2P4UIW0_9ACTN|nr:hypothetical protein [Actinomadura rubteroloni]POM24994.1 hypothetical protein BTM25_36350 [Actinomadura rubteroloni]